MGLLNTIKSAVKKNPDKAAQGVDKATDLIDDRTGNKYTDKLDKVDDLAADKLGAGRPDTDRQPASDDRNDPAETEPR